MARRRRRRRNPISNPLGVGAVRRYFQGVDMTDALAAGGGLIATSIVPGMIITDAVTTGKKLAKLGVALATAAAVGMAAKSVSPSAAKFAVAGSLAGLVVQGVDMVSPGLIGRSGVQRRLIGNTPRGPGLGGVVPTRAKSEESEIITNVT